jgi:hypothetical protein
VAPERRTAPGADADPTLMQGMDQSTDYPTAVPEGRRFREYSAAAEPISPGRAAPDEITFGPMTPPLQRCLVSPPSAAREAAHRFPPPATARPGDGRPRGILSGGTQLERHDRSSTMDPKSTNETGRTLPTLASRGALESRPPRRSRAAEYIAALYIALVLCTPWLVRDSNVLMPPSMGLEIQVVSKAFAASMPRLPSE